MLLVEETKTRFGYDPCAETEEQVRELFQLSNLWPICARCNLSVKKDKKLEELNLKGDVAEATQSVSD